MQALHAADAAGDEDLHAGHVREEHRARDGRPAVPALGDASGEVAPGDLLDRAFGAELRESVELVVGEAA